MSRPRTRAIARPRSKVRTLCVAPTQLTSGNTQRPGRTAAKVISDTMCKQTQQASSAVITTSSDQHGQLAMRDSSTKATARREQLRSSATTSTRLRMPRTRQQNAFKKFAARLPSFFCKRDASGGGRRRRWQLADVEARRRWPRQQPTRRRSMAVALSAGGGGADGAAAETCWPS